MFIIQVFTQNIDSLESLAGVNPELVVAAHGNFDSATCIETGKKVDINEVRTAILAGEEGWKGMSEKHGGLVKPDIVFFGENLPERFFHHTEEDFPQCDLLIVMGTSLQVEPFASLVDTVSRGALQLYTTLQVITNQLEVLTEKEGHVANKILEIKKQAITLYKSEKAEKPSHKALMLMRQAKVYEMQQSSLERMSQNMLIQKVAMEKIVVQKVLKTAHGVIKSIIESGVVSPDTTWALQGITTQVETLTEQEGHLANKILEMKKQAATSQSLYKSRRESGKAAEKTKARVLQLRRRVKVYETQRDNLDSMIQSMVVEKVAIEDVMHRVQTQKITETAQDVIKSSIDSDHVYHPAENERESKVASQIGTPRILINRETVGQKGCVFDVELLGDCDDGVRALAAKLGWADDLEALIAAGSAHLQQQQQQAPNAGGGGKVGRNKRRGRRRRRRRW